jgi:HlyD family secretion protein
VNTRSIAPSLLHRRPAPDPTLPAILEFQWPSTAVANAPVPRSARGVVWVITSMVVILIATLGLVPVDQVVVARGIVVAKLPTIVVQPLETSIVRAIEVREGQRVERGEVLARLDPTFAAADLGSLTARASSLAAEVSRLETETRNGAFDYAGNDPQMQLQAAISARRKAEYAARIEGYARKADELSAQVSRAQSDVAGYRDRLELAHSVEAMREQLQSLQLGSRLNTLAAKDNRAEMARALANAEQTAEAIKRDLAALLAERDGYVAGWHADVLRELSEAGRNLSDAQEALNKAKLRRRLVELRATADATVQSVAKVSVGSVLQSGDQLMTLVPASAPLEIEAEVSGNEAGFVRIGDPVAIKFDTFPYAQYGMAAGRVRILSPTSFTAEEEARHPTAAVPVSPASTEPYYLARIAIDKVALHDTPPGFRIIPGMPVNADIKVGKRTVLGYLMGRIAPLVREGMREP